MKRIFTWMIVGLALVWLGCPARSIFPLLTPAEHVFPPALSGKWVLVEESSRDTVTFINSGDECIIQSPAEGEGTAPYQEYQAYTRQLGEYWYLDTYPKSSDIPAHTLPIHMIHRFQVLGDTLKIASLEMEWLRELTKRQALSLPHLILDDEVILTASTAELQAFVQQHAADPGAFPDPGVYRRVR